MRHDEIEVPVEPLGDVVLPRAAPRVDGMRDSIRDNARDASLGELFKRLTSDTGELIRQETALAKAELRETGSALVGDARELGIAFGLALAGSLALVAFLVIALGNLLGDRYWLSSLIVGVIALGVGATLAKSAIDDMKKRGITPKQTLDTLKEDKQWASQQARELSHDLTTDPTRPAIRR